MTTSYLAKSGTMDRYLHGFLQIVIRNVVTPHLTRTRSIDNLAAGKTYSQGHARPALRHFRSKAKGK
jgi:hypothetical protein